MVDLPSASPAGDEPLAVGPGPQERAWRAAEVAAAEAMGTVNPALARLVAAVVDLLAADGWQGAGIRSPEHWLTWKAGVSHGRAAGLVQLARRAGDLPACFALFAKGRLGEDAMVRIARRVPASRDAEIAALAPTLLITQLDRVLRSLPEQADGTTRRPDPERVLRLRDSRDGWTRGQFCLPADEGALVRLGLTAARDAEFSDRNATRPTASTPMSTGWPTAPGRCPGLTDSSAWPPKQRTRSTPPLRDRMPTSTRQANSGLTGDHRRSPHP